MEVLKKKFNYLKSYQLYYYRDSNGNEVDLILDYNTHIDAIEIKSSATFDKDFMKGLKYIRSVFGPRVKNTTICYAGDLEQKIGDDHLVNFMNIARTSV